MEYLHIDYEPAGRSWVLKILTRLHQSSNLALRERASTWASSALRENGMALATKLTMVSIVAGRIDRQLQRLSGELCDQHKISEHLRRGAAYTVASKNLPYEILVDIDSFFFESRSAYEIVGWFLKEFFDHILAQRIDESELISVLDSRGIDTRWIGELQANRILFFHKTAPWIALHVVSKDPFQFELVLLKKDTKDFGDQSSLIRFEQLREIYRGFESSLDLLYNWITDQIVKIEDKGTA